MGIFVVDTHVHAQRHAFKFKERGIKPDYAALAGGMSALEAYDNSPRLLYHMERYGVDMCVIQPAFGMTNEINADLVKRYPDRFLAMCSCTNLSHKIARGEVTWSIDAACREIDEQLSTGYFKGGIGEGLPRNPKPTKVLDWNERYEEICRFMELARKHKVPVSYHTGVLSGYGGVKGTFHPHGDWGDPLLAHDVAAAYPDVPIILAHGGVQGWWGTSYYEKALEVTAAHPNVYLETGLYWTELFEKPLLDPNIGVEKLLWGTDWGASIPQQWMPGQHPASYADQNSRLGPPAHQVDYYGWCQRQLERLDIPQDDLNLILGGNACRLFGIEPPLTRLFKEYLPK